MADHCVCLSKVVRGCCNNSVGALSNSIADGDLVCDPDCQSGALDDDSPLCARDFVMHNVGVAESVMQSFQCKYCCHHRDAFT